MDRKNELLSPVLGLRILTPSWGADSRGQSFPDRGLFSLPTAKMWRLAHHWVWPDESAHHQLKNPRSELH